MKRILMFSLTFMPIAAFGEEVKQFGHLRASYSEDNLSLNEALIGLSKDYDAHYSVLASLKVTPEKAYLYEGYVKANELLGHDVAKVGLQKLPYSSLTGVDTAWLGSQFITQAGVLPERDGAVVYGYNFGVVNVAASVRNDVPVDKHQTYGLTVNGSIVPWLQGVASAEHSDATKDNTYVSGLLAKGFGATGLLEYALQDTKQGSDKASWGLTGTYAFSDKHGAYAQYVSGDKAWQDRGFVRTYAVGPYTSLNQNIRVALVGGAKEYVEETKSNLAIRVEASL